MKMSAAVTSHSSYTAGFAKQGGTLTGWRISCIPGGSVGVTDCRIVSSQMKRMEILTGYRSSCTLHRSHIKELLLLAQVLPQNI